MVTEEEEEEEEEGEGGSGGRSREKQRKHGYQWGRFKNDFYKGISTNISVSK